MRSTAPIGSPGWNGLASCDGVAVAEVDAAPLGTATKFIASRYLPKRLIVSGAKLDSESGTAIGLAALLDICFAPKSAAIFSQTASVFQKIAADLGAQPMSRREEHNL